MKKINHLFKFIKMKSKKLILTLLISLGANGIFAQNQEINLDWCIQKAKSNLPLIKKFELIEQSKAYSIENASKGLLPQINIIGQGTYQSEVTKVPISVPNFDIPTISKDQYRAYTEVYQSLNNKKLVDDKIQLLESQAALEKSHLEVSIYQVEEKVNEVYFGILLIQEQLNLNSLYQNQLKNTSKKLESALANGVGNGKNILEISAEILRLKQKSIDLNGIKLGFIGMLSKLTGEKIELSSQFIRPSDEYELANENLRPELKSFDASLNLLTKKEATIDNQLRPQLGLFVQGGIGRPALNMLSNDFRGYYIGGLRLNWNIGNYYTYKNNKKLLEIEKQTIGIQKDQFLQNLSVQDQRENAEIIKLREMVNLDEPIIQLKTQVKEIAEKELELGSIGANDYLDYLSQEELAKENKAIHEIQLLNAIYKNKITKGQ